MALFVGKGVKQMNGIDGVQAKVPLRFEDDPGVDKGKNGVVVEGNDLLAVDVGVNLRPDSPTFGKWFGLVLSEENKRQLYIPEGFAHGFCVLSRYAHVAYKCSDYYDPEEEYGLLWSDPDIGIDWPVEDPILSAKDRQFGCLKDLDL